MNSTAKLDHVFPLSAGSSERAALHAPRIAASLPVTPGVVMGHGTFLRAWAARRANPAPFADGASLAPITFVKPRPV